MALVKLNSGAILQVEYSLKKQELDVLFKDGALVSYKGVPKKVFEELIKADSAGYYFNTEIRNKYNYS